MQMNPIRRIGALATAVVLAAAMAACGSGGGVPSDPSQVSGKVTMWIYPIGADLEKTWWQPKVAEFRKKYPKVNVDVVVQPWANRDEQLTTAIAGNKGPDVVYLIPDQLSQYADTGALADVTDVISSDRSDFRDNALQAMTYDGKLYGVPLLMSVTTTMVNKKVMQAAGVTSVPQTWDDLLAAAPKFKAKGYYATYYIGDPKQTLNQTFYPLLWQAGGEVLSADGKKCTINSAAGLKALEFVKKLIDNGYTPKDALTAAQQAETSPFAQGKVGVTISTASADLATYKLSKENYQVGPPLKDVKSVGYGTVGGLSVLQSSQNAAAAKAWVQWVTSTAQMKEFDKSRSYFPPRKSVGSLYASDPLVGGEEKYLDQMRPGVISPQGRALMDLIKPHLQAALLGKVTPKQALDAAAAEVDALLARS
ncbi:ABC transporter substrate-binding protein [Fodinicola acaciae]|uniref:ABC transporter substrate-binding protein n=1 Tax=Fodinicola acaciae TaxID=2681555 RepID=UPI0013D63143|nr:sugar ABC transporter substrate-binding protein [Fodinicola acaciae]